MKKDLWGQGKQCYVPGSSGKAITTADSVPVQVGTALYLNSVDNLAVQLVTIGNATGTWTFKASNDFIPTPMGENGAQGQVEATANWSPYTPPVVPAAVAAASSQILEWRGFCPRGLQIFFTPTGGSGTRTALAIIFGKGQS